MARPASTRLGTALVLVSAIAATLTACSHSSAGPSAAAPAAATPRTAATNGTLSGAELRYGQSPTRDPSIVYQPDVVLVGGGANAIDGASANGLVWDLKASAPGVSGLTVGKIVFASAFAVGRVGAITDVGSDRRVVLTPVGLTDIVSDGDFASSQPLDLTSALAYSTPERPGLQAGTGSSGVAGAQLKSVRTAGPPAVPAVPAVSDLPSSANIPVKTPMLPPVKVPATVSVGDFSVTPFCCEGGLGVRLGYAKSGGELLATLTLQVTKPTVVFHIAIHGGKLTDASLHLTGASALLLDIKAATLDVGGNFHSPNITIPVSFTVPLFGLPIPLTASVTQSFQVSLQLGGRASLHTHGSFAVSGELGFGYVAGQPAADATVATSSTSLLKNLTVVSVAPSSIVLHYAARLSLGVGMLGFTAGAWYQLTTGVGLLSDGGLLPSLTPCMDGSVDMTGTYGVGYSIPVLVAKVVNVFLNLLNVRPINASDGLQWGPHTIWSVPGSQRCKLRLP